MVWEGGDRRYVLGGIGHVNAIGQERLNDIHAGRAGIGIQKIDWKVGRGEMTEIRKRSYVRQPIVTRVEPVKIVKADQAIQIAQPIVVRVQGAEPWQQWKAAAIADRGGLRINSL